MNQDRPKDPTSAYLRQVVIPLAANFEASTHQVVVISEVLGVQAPETQVALAEFLDKIAEMFVTIGVLTASNKELAEQLETSMVTKATNARSISENARHLRRVDPFLIGVFIEEVSNQDIMNDALDGIKDHGPVAVMRLEWIADWLVKKGFIKQGDCDD